MAGLSVAIMTNFDEGILDANRVYLGRHLRLFVYSVSRKDLRSCNKAFYSWPGTLES